MSNPSPTELALAYRQEAQALRAQGQHTAALEAYERAAVAARQQTDDPALEALVQIGRIDSLGVLGFEDEGIALGETIAATLTAVGRTEDSARARMNVANLLYRKDRHREALEAFEQVAALFAQAGNLPLAARAAANAANALSYLGRLSEARELLDWAAARFADDGQAVLQAMAEANLGYLHFLAGRFGPALAALTHAHATFAVTPGAALETAKCAADRADIYQALNLLPEARADYEAALPVFTATPLPYEAARAYLGLAEVALAQGDAAAATAALQEAESRFAAQKNTLHLGRVALLRAVLTTDPAAAQTAERLFLRCSQRGWAAEARFLSSQNSPARLRGLLRAARRWSRGWLECRVWQRLGQLHRDQGNTAAALRAFRSGLTVLESVRTALAAPEELHVAFLGDKVSLYTDLMDTLLVRGRPQDRAEALAVLERSRSRLVLERLARGGTPTEATFDLLRLREQLSEVYYRLNGFPDETRRYGGVADRFEVQRCEQAYRDALRKVALRTPRLSSSTAPEPLDIAGLPLRANEALVAYYTTATAVHAFVLQPGGTITLRRALCSLADLRQATRRLRFHLHAGASTSVAEANGVLELLDTLLIAPLEADLGVAQRLIIAPHGPLHGLPFHAFLHQGQALLERFVCTTTPSITLWEKGRRRPTPDGHGAAIFAVPSASIPAVADEAEAVAQQLPESQLFCGAAAQLTRFFQAAPGARYLHLATHALFRADNPLFSGLQLSDGWILARDIDTLSLQQCELVTLSACQTGVASVAPGDDTFGLVRAFLTAGARSVVASLWVADDHATRFLMERFYNHARQQDRGLAEALQCAQQALRAAKPHPYYWAPFTVLGQG